LTNLKSATADRHYPTKIRNIFSDSPRIIEQIRQGGEFASSLNFSNNEMSTLLGLTRRLRSGAASRPEFAAEPANPASRARQSCHRSSRSA